jgi:hypothetical protein
MSHPEDAAPAQVGAWYVEILRKFGEAQGRLLWLYERGGSLGDQAQEAQGVALLLDEIVGALQAMEGGLMSGAELPKVRGYAEALQEALSRPDRREPDSQEGNARAFLEYRQSLEDRMYAVGLLLEDVKTFLFARGLFAVKGAQA